MAAIQLAAARGARVFTTAGSADKCAFPTFTLGGLWTKPTGEVLTEEGNVIPGLYAAGRTTSGFPAAGYNSGMAVADCTFFGRVAGQTAAKTDRADRPQRNRRPARRPRVATLSPRSDLVIP